MIHLTSQQYNTEYANKMIKNNKHPQILNVYKTKQLKAMVIIAQILRQSLRQSNMRWQLVFLQAKSLSCNCLFACGHHLIIAPYMNASFHHTKIKHSNIHVQWCLNIHNCIRKYSITRTKCLGDMTNCCLKISYFLNKSCQHLIKITALTTTTISFNNNYGLKPTLYQIFGTSNRNLAVDLMSLLFLFLSFELLADFCR